MRPQFYKISARIAEIVLPRFWKSNFSWGSTPQIPNFVNYFPTLNNSKPPTKVKTSYQTCFIDETANSSYFVSSKNKKKDNSTEDSYCMPYTYLLLNIVKKTKTYCLPTKKKRFVQSVSPDKKNSCISNERKKNSCELKIPHPPPYNFSNGPSLEQITLKFGKVTNFWMLF